MSRIDKFFCCQAEIQLFGSRSSRSPLVEWYLKEIDQPYTHR